MSVSRDLTAEVRADEQAAAVPAPPILRHAVLAFWIVATSCALATTTLTDQALFLVFGWAACLIVTLPFALKDYDLVSPWSFVILTIYIGCGLRPIFIAGDIESGNRSLDALFLLGKPPSFFIESSLYFLAGTALLTAGYMLSGKKVDLGERTKPWVFATIAPAVVAVSALIGFGAFILFAQRTGGLSLAVLSAKRTSISSLDLTGYQSYGLLRQLSEFSRYAYWIAMAMFAASGKRSPARTIVLVLLFLNAIALPIYASSRADAGYILIVGVIISLCLAPERSRRVGLVILRGSLVVVAIVSVLTVLRTGSGSTADLAEQQDITESIGQTFVYNRNFTDIPSSAQIMEAVPVRLAPANGSTYLAWLVAPVPREWWPEKPLVSSGPEIGVKVFGQVSSGVPPGLVAEAYWNFGLPGLLLISSLVGVGLRRVYEWWRPRLRNPASAVIFAGAFLRLGEGAVANSLGYAVFQTLVGSVLLYALMRLVVERPAAEATEAGKFVRSRGV